MVNIYCSIKVYISYLLTYLLNIDIDIAIFRQYHIDIVSKSEKKWYWNITNVRIPCEIVDLRRFLILASAWRLNSPLSS